MLVISESTLKIEHVMWQPTANCIRGCTGCYVAASNSASYTGLVDTEILDLIYISKKLQCNQFTISVDTLKEYPENFIMSLRGAIVMAGNKDPDYPMLCFTVHDWRTWKNFMKALALSDNQIYGAMSILSVSAPDPEISILKHKCAMHNVVLNYNCLVSYPIGKADYFIRNVNNTHQTYLILKKAPLGEAPDFKHVEAWIDTIKDLPEKKVIIQDACMVDTAKYINVGGSCTAGIDKLMLWPNGDVTGCPYDSKNKYGKSKKDFPSLIERLQEVTSSKNPSPSKSCRIINTLRDYKLKQSLS